MNAKKLLAFSAMSLALACAGEAKADFAPLQFVTYDQTDWGSGGAAASILSASYDSVYAAENDVLTVGVLNETNLYYMAFSDSGAILTYQPSSGTPGPLTASLTNPTTTSSGVFGGDVVALTLNVDFSNAGLIGQTSSVPFGDLVLENLPFIDELNGLTVNEFLADANTCLGGGPCVGLATVDAVTQSLNAAFEEGTPDAFADDYLALPSSVTPTPEPSSLLLLASGLASLGFLRRRFVRASPPRAG